MAQSSSRISELLQCPDVYGQWELLDKLYHTAESAASVDKLLSDHTSCLSAVVKLLDSSSSEVVQEQAARVLGRFALAGSAYQHKVVHSDGAVAGLVALLVSSDAAVQCQACLALKHLVSRAPLEIKERVGHQPHAVERLAALLKSGEAAVELAAAQAIADLTDGCPANRDSVGQVTDATGGLVAMLSSSHAGQQHAATTALANLAMQSPANSKRISQVPGVVAALVELVRSKDAPVHVQHAAALAVVSAAEGGGIFLQALQVSTSADIWTALSNMDQLTNQSNSDLLELSRLLHRLAAGSAALRQSMAGSKELKQLLNNLQQ
jgi:hypothetical protein